MTMKRGTKIEVGLAYGQIASGKVVKAVAIPFYAKPGVDLWYLVSLTGPHGGRTTVHHSALQATK